ncbi:response regulator [Oleiagrimonas sp. C23AA]|uniref:response regulator n=1 Tax=Oleiagrimonas sp. C23AA TaxID=2719047 RepID=UPI00141F56B8|nr:response regulator [Oleiagrimonas sp. C23AA]NII10617.1 response regulator [Oleiagrimonas sp. C23AA]
MIEKNVASRIGRFLGILALLCASTLLAWLIYAFIQHQANQHSDRVRNRAAIELTQRTIGGVLGNVRGDVHMLIQSSVVHDYLDDPTSAHEQSLQRLFERLARLRGSYAQLRLLDEQGHERVRVDSHGSATQLIQGHQLQDKASSYYVKAIRQLPPGQLYISPMDLNVEHGRVQQPWLPTIRVGAGVFDADGMQKGMVVVNLDGRGLIAQLRQDAGLAVGSMWLLDRDGHWLIGPSREDDWSYMQTSGRRGGLPQRYPQVWGEVRAQQAGQLETDAGLLTFANISLGASVAGAPPSMLRLVSLRSGDGLDWFPSLRFWPFYLVTFLLLALIAAWIARQQELLGRERETTEANSRLLNDIFQHSPLMMKVKDLEGRILRVNETGARMIGRDASVLEGETLKPVASQATLAMIAEHDAEVMRTNRVTQYEENVAYVGGSYTLLTTRFPVTGKRGSIIGVGAVSVDISARIHTEEVLRLAKIEAESANQAKSAFLANMSHELRTPLNSIIGLSELLIEDLEEDNQNQHVEPVRRVVQAGRHLLYLINDLLDLSRVEAGRMELRLENCLVRDVVDVVAGSMQPLIEANGNRFHVDIAAEVELVHADPVRLRQVLMNLLSNAGKFTHNGTVHLQVACAGNGNERRVSFTVADSGIGMDPAQLETVFEPFHQADPSISRRYGGTGLGLAITRQLVLLMGGDIRVDSAVGRGSTFTVYLASGMLGDSRGGASTSLADRRPAGSPWIDHDNGEGGTRGHTVLIVDDDPDAVQVLANAIRRQDVRVVVASSGAQALAMARSEAPDLMLLDILLGDMNGWDVLGALRADPLFAELPVIVCTITDREQRMVSLGVAEHLSKPVDRNRLRALVRRFIPEGDSAVIAIADDDATYRQLLAEILRREGHVVFDVGSGGEVLDVIRQDPCDLVLLDLFMPGMDGIEVIERMREDPQLADTEVVLITAADINGQLLDRIQSKAMTLVRKQAEPVAAIVERVRGMLARMRKRPHTDSHGEGP